MTELQGEDPFQQPGIAPGHAVQGQQQLLLKHALAPVHPAGACDPFGDGAAVQGVAEPCIGGVVAAHDHLFLTHQQIGQGIFQLGMDHAHRTGAAPHHTPVLAAQSAVVHLLQQLLNRHAAAVRTGFKGLGSEASLQQVQNVGLFMQRLGVPQPPPQDVSVGFVELLFFSGREIAEVGGVLQQSGSARLQGHRLGVRTPLSQGHPTGLNGQLFQLVELHRDVPDAAAEQRLSQLQEHLGMMLEGFSADGDQQQRQPGTTPVTPQQMEFIHHAVLQLKRVIGQVADAVLQHRRREGQGLFPQAVQPCGVLGFDALHRFATQAEPRIGPDGAPPGCQGIRGLDCDPITTAQR